MIHAQLELSEYGMPGYVATCEDVDTDYGPEIRVIIRNPNNAICYNRSEPASMKQQVEWWIEEIS